MSKKNLVVLISGSGSNLQSFIDKIDAGQLDANIAGVVSNRADAYGLVRAAKAGIKTSLVEHDKFSDRLSFDRELMAVIDEYRPDLVILAGFMRILSAEFVNHYQGKLLNIHPSLLPKYKGLHTHRRALENGDEYHGTSVHFVTEELDGGPVIAQARLKILPEHNEQSLMQDVQKMEHQLYPLVAQWVVNGTVALTDDGLLFNGAPLETPKIIEQSDL